MIAGSVCFSAGSAPACTVRLVLNHFLNHFTLFNNSDTITDNERIEKIAYQIRRPKYEIAKR